MTKSALRIVWSLAVILAVSAGSGLAMLGHYGQSATAADVHVPIVVIGSSLLRYAVPYKPIGPAGLLGDGRTHVRFGVSLISEMQTIALISQAIDSGAKTIFVEINALGFDLAEYMISNSRENWWSNKLFSAVAQLSDQAKTGLELCFGRRRAAPGGVEPSDIDQPYLSKLQILTQYYPLNLHLPRDGRFLADTLKRARQRGVEIVLIAPPRSQTAADYMGAAAMDALRAHLTKVARSLDLALFFPSTTWPDDDFIDQAHMNRRGRARFDDELAVWWAHRS